MSELEIKNIGPIKYVKFNINKINVFYLEHEPGYSTKQALNQKYICHNYTIGLITKIKV